MEDTTIEDVLKTFEDFYVKKDYQNALLTLKSNGNKISPELLHYNLGTVYAQTGNMPLARFHFLKAKEEGFSGDQVSQNLKIVETKLDVQKLEKPLGPLDYAIKASMFVSNGLLTSLALVILIFGLLFLKKSGPNLKKAFVVILIASVPLGLDQWIRKWPKAIVTKPQLILEGPSAIFKGSEELSPGTFIISKKEGNWRKIIYPSRFSGWIMDKDVKELE